MNRLQRIINDIQSRTHLDASELEAEVITNTFDDKTDFLSEMFKHPGDDAYLGKCLRQAYEQARDDVIRVAERDAEDEDAEYKAEIAKDARDRARDINATYREAS